MQKLFKHISPTSPDYETLKTADMSGIIEFARKYKILDE